MSVWSAVTGQKLLTFQDHAVIHAIAFSPDGQRIVTGTEDQSARVWDAGSGRQLVALAGHSGEVMGVAFSPDGRRIATGSRDRTVKIWEAATPQQVAGWKKQSTTE